MWKSLFCLWFSLWVGERKTGGRRESFGAWRCLNFQDSNDLCMCTLTFRGWFDDFPLMSDFISALLSCAVEFWCIPPLSSPRTIMHSELRPFRSHSLQILFRLSVPSSLWYFDRVICSSVKKTHFPHRLLEGLKNVFVKETCWENSSLSACVDVPDLHRWVTTPRNLTGS